MYRDFMAKENGQIETNMQFVECDSNGFFAHSCIFISYMQFTTARNPNTPNAA